MSERYAVVGENNVTNGWFTFNTDVRGSITNILDSNGLTVTGYVYDEYGNQIKTGEEDFLNEATYTGAVYDEEIGLYYMNARYYDCTTGQFISRDTYLGNAYNPWTQNLYTYTGNNPVNYTDPTGHFVNTIVGGVMGAVFGGVSAALSGGDVWAGIGSGYWSGLIMGAGVDIAIATGGTAAIVAVAISGFSGAATGELITQLSGAQSIDALKISLKGVLGIGYNMFGYFLSAASSSIAWKESKGLEYVIDSVFELGNWAVSSLISFVANVPISTFDNCSSGIYDHVVYLQETAELMKTWADKYEAIYASVGEIKGPCTGNYKWL